MQLCIFRLGIFLLDIHKALVFSVKFLVRFLQPLALRQQRADTDNLSEEAVSDFVVGGENFGCGSSREHAPISIKAAGVSCVIAETFARIFYRNAINIGLPIIECPDAAKEIEAGDEVEVNLDTGVITDKTKGTSYQGQAFPPFMQKIIDCEGLVNYINQK